MLPTAMPSRSVLQPWASVITRLRRGHPGRMGMGEADGSIRRECLDDAVIPDKAHLRRVLAAYANYYNELRTRRSLTKDTPLRRAVERLGSVVSRPILAGLHHQYRRSQYQVHTDGHKKWGARPVIPHLSRYCDNARTTHSR
jgi:hypothetical protein